MALLGRRRSGEAGIKDTMQAVREMGNAPVTAFQKAELKFYEIYGSPKVESSRWFLVSLALLGMVLALVIAIVSIMPLKRVVPFLIGFDEKSGATLRRAEAKEYTPDAAIRGYFLRDWAEKTFTVDRFLTDKNLKFAYSRTRGKASLELQDFLNEDKPFKRMADDKNYTRVVKIISVDPGKSTEVGFVRFQTEERSGQNEPRIRRYMLTVHYALVPPEEEQDLWANPIGLFVTHFVKSEELGN